MNATKIRILVVGGDSGFFELIRLNLNEPGIEVIGSITGRIAMMLLENDPPDLLLLDETLADMDGVEMCRIVKNNPVFNSVTIIITTGLPVSSARTVQCLAAGADSYITKNIPLEELLARIYAVLRVYRAEIIPGSDLLDYESICSNMPNGFMYGKILFENEIPVDCKIIVVNPAFAKHTGIENAAGKRITEVIPGLRSSMPELGEIYLKLVVTGKPVKSEIFIEALNQWFDYILSLLYQEQEGYFTIVLENITDRKQSEIDQRNSDERLRQITEVSFDCIWEADATGMYTFCSENIRDLYGVSAEETIGHRYLYDDLVPGDQESNKALMVSILEGRERYNREKRVIHANGQVKIIQDVGIPIIDSEGNIIGYRGASQDITQQTELIEKLRFSEEKFSTAYNNAPVLLSISELETGKYIDVNTKFLQVSGFTREEVIGKTSVEMQWITPENRLKILQEFREKGAVSEMHLSLRSKSGECVICRYNGQSIMINGKPHILSMAKDISKQVKLDENLKINELSLRQIQMNPHFIFNALNSIQGHILKKENKIALDFLSRISQLIRMTLELSCKQFIPLQEELVFLNNYLNIEEMRSGDIFTKEITIDPKINLRSTMVPPLIIQPLIENAIKYGIMRAMHSGKLLIEFAKKNSRVLLVSIQDNGSRIESSDFHEENQDFSKRLNVLNIIKDRFRLLNEINNTDIYGMSVINLADAPGDQIGIRVEVVLPITRRYTQ